MQDVKIENRPDLALVKTKDFEPVCYNCSSQCDRYDKCKGAQKMAKAVQVWWNGKLVDIVSDLEARKILADGNAVQIAENMIKITPKW